MLHSNAADRLVSTRDPRRADKKPRRTPWSLRPSFPAVPPFPCRQAHFAGRARDVFRKRGKHEMLK